MTKKCDQCTWVYINGVFCHETGCLHQYDNWNEETQLWEEPDDYDSNYIEDEDDWKD